MTERCQTCGQTLQKRRSVPQLRRYMALMDAAFMHWPEGHARQFTNATELRKHYEMVAGYKDVAAQIPLSGISRERAIHLAEMVLRSVGNFAEPYMADDVLIIYKPRSVSFESLNSRDASALFDDVATIIEQETGFSPEDLLRHGEQV